MLQAPSRTNCRRLHLHNPKEDVDSLAWSTLYCILYWSGIRRARCRNCQKLSRVLSKMLRSLKGSQEAKPAPGITWHYLAQPPIPREEDLDGLAFRLSSCQASVRGIRTCNQFSCEALLGSSFGSAGPIHSLKSLGVGFHLRPTRQGSQDEGTMSVWTLHPASNIGADCKDGMPV